MKLKLVRTQKETGIVTKTMVFCLDARVEMTPEESDAVKKYKLGKQVIYNSEASKQHLERGAGGIASGGLGGAMKAYAQLALSKMSLNISIDSLTQGQHVECKDMDELLGAEGAIRSACEQMKSYIETSKTFDGQEMVFEI